MKNFIGRHQALTDTDYLELALGTPLDLWLGEDGESDEERAARLDAARDILADDLDLYDRALRAAAQALDGPVLYSNGRLGTLHILPAVGETSWTAVAA